MSAKRISCNYNKITERAHEREGEEGGEEEDEEEEVEAAPAAEKQR